MKKLFGIIFFLLFFFNFKFVANAAITSPEYYSSAFVVPYTTACTFPCGTLSQTCWNSQSVGQTDCGVGCEPGQGSQTWTKYGLYQTGCFENYSIDQTGSTCTPVYTVAGDTCSTADKYNSSNPPVLNAGFCDCTVGGPYKTCCANGSQVDAQPVNIDPYPPPEGQCGTAIVVYCGGAGQPACGQQACATPPPVTPPPSTCAGVSLTCSNPQCPSGYTVVKLSTGNYACYNNSTGTIDCNTAPYCQGPCPNTGGWTGQSCSGPSAPNISQACSTDSTTCSKCSSAVCTLYDPSTNLYCYYNNGTCYVDYTACKGFGTCGTCIPGSTKIECSTPNYCPTP